MIHRENLFKVLTLFKFGRLASRVSGLGPRESVLSTFSLSDSGHLAFRNHFLKAYSILPL